MISRDEILKGQYCPPDLEDNLQQLLTALNMFRNVWGNPMIVTSGYRTVQHNADIGGKPGSAHLTCQAADFQDTDKVLQRFCLGNTKLLADCQLWMEDPKYTPNWVHLQCRPANRRVFIP